MELIFLPKCEGLIVDVGRCFNLSCGPGGYVTIAFGADMQSSLEMLLSV